MLRHPAIGKFVNIIVHPVSIAIIPFVILALYFSPEFSKYSLRQISLEENTRLHVFYHDINADGKNEKIELFNYPTRAAVEARTMNEGIVQAWSLKGQWMDPPQVRYDDLNGDGILELYGVTISNNDSLLVHHLEIKPEDSPGRTIPVTQLKRESDEFDYKISVHAADVAGNEMSEIVIKVSGGFILQPRCLYAWDLSRNSIIRSPYSGMNMKWVFQITPGNTQNGSKIFLKTDATDNYNTPISYPDTSSYAAVLGSNLEYVFPPITLGNRQSSTTTFPLNTPNSNSYIAVTIFERRDSLQTKLSLIDSTGKVINSIETDQFDKVFNLFAFNGAIIISSFSSNRTTFYSINEDLSFDNLANYRGKLYFSGALNLDDDENLEMIFRDNINHTVAVMEDDFQTITYSESDPTHISARLIGKIPDNEGSNDFYAYSPGETLMRFSYGANKLYPFRFFYYPLLFLAIWLVVYAIQKATIYQLNRRKAVEDKLLNFQLTTIMNQLNPHFTFNAINSIGNAVINGEKDEAYDFFSKLSDLVRESMMNAFKPYKTLAEELEFVKKYLEIESYRFGDKFEWSVDVGWEVNQDIIIPKMLIHLFVENALKHGIFHRKEGGGTVSVDIQAEKKNTIIFVRDNGVGRKKAKEIEGKTGNGIKILENYLNVFRKMKKTRIDYRITDGKTGGTDVRISIQGQKADM